MSPVATCRCRGFCSPVRRRSRPPTDRAAPGRRVATALWRNASLEPAFAGRHCGDVLGEGLPTDEGPPSTGAAAARGSGCGGRSGRSSSCWLRGHGSWSQTTGGRVAPPSPLRLATRCWEGWREGGAGREQKESRRRRTDGREKERPGGSADRGRTNGEEARWPRAARPGQAPQGDGRGRRAWRPVEVTATTASRGGHDRSGAAVAATGSRGAASAASARPRSRSRPRTADATDRVGGGHNVGPASIARWRCRGNAGHGRGPPATLAAVGVAAPSRARLPAPPPRRRVSAGRRPE